MTKTRVQPNHHVSHVHQKLLHSINNKQDFFADREEIRINYLIRLADQRGEDFLVLVRKISENEIIKLNLRYVQKYQFSNPSLGAMFFQDYNLYAHRKICSEIDNALVIVRAIDASNEESLKRSLR